MSAEWDSDDFARLLALEHAFGALALISAANFALGANTTPAEAVAHFRAAIESSITTPLTQRRTSVRGCGRT